MLHPSGFLTLLMPLVTAGLIALIGWALYRRGPRWSVVLAPLIVLGPALADHAYSTGEFHKACRAAGAATIFERAQANGFLLRSDHASGFGAQHLEDGFRWIERRTASGWERVTRQPDGSVRTQPISQPTARYMVIDKVDRARSWTLVSRSVFEREDERMIALASYVLYNGGWLTVLLAPFADATCPPSDRPGVWGPAGYFKLVLETLQPAGRDPAPKP